MRYLRYFCRRGKYFGLSLVIAVVSVRLAANYRFALSKFFDYDLIHPFAISTYIFSFCYVGIID